MPPYTLPGYPSSYTLLGTLLGILYAPRCVLGVSAGAGVEAKSAWAQLGRKSLG